MKKLSLVLLVSVLFLMAFSPALAASDLRLVVDNGQILLPEEENDLQEKADALCSQYSIDVVILTVDSLDGWTAQDYADNFYDSQGYGDDGILILLAMKEREWYISVCGNVIYAVTDYGTQQLGDAAVACFSTGDYAGGFLAFLQELDVFMNAYENGAPIDGYADTSNGYYHGDREETVYYEEEKGVNWLLSLGIGLAAAGAAIFVMRSSMDTKKPQKGASGYISTGSFRLHTHRDLFLHSKVHKVRRQQNQSSSRGGGSSVHRSSSGRRHGGGGGRF